MIDRRLRDGWANDNKIAFPPTHVSLEEAGFSADFIRGQERMGSGGYKLTAPPPPEGQTYVDDEGNPIAPPTTVGSAFPDRLADAEIENPARYMDEQPTGADMRRIKDFYRQVAVSDTPPSGPSTPDELLGRFVGPEEARERQLRGGTNFGPMGEPLAGVKYRPNEELDRGVGSAALGALDIFQRATFDIPTGILGIKGQEVLEQLGGGTPAELAAYRSALQGNTTGNPILDAIAEVSAAGEVSRRALARAPENPEVLGPFRATDLLQIGLPGTGFFGIGALAKINKASKAAKVAAQFDGLAKKAGYVDMRDLAKAEQAFRDGVLPVAQQVKLLRVPAELRDSMHAMDFGMAKAEQELVRQPAHKTSPEQLAEYRREIGMPETVNAETLSQRIGVPTTDPQKVAIDKLNRAVRQRSDVRLREQLGEMSVKDLIEEGAMREGGSGGVFITDTGTITGPVRTTHAHALNAAFGGNDELLTSTLYADMESRGLIRGYFAGGSVYVDVPANMKLSDKQVQTLRSLELRSRSPLKWDISSKETGSFTDSGSGLDNLLEITGKKGFLAGEGGTADLNKIKDMVQKKAKAKPEVKTEPKPIKDSIRDVEKASLAASRGDKESVQRYIDRALKRYVDHGLTPDEAAELIQSHIKHPRDITTRLKDRMGINEAANKGEEVYDPYVMGKGFSDIEPGPVHGKSGKRVPKKISPEKLESMSEDEALRYLGDIKEATKGTRSFSEAIDHTGWVETPEEFLTGKPVEIVGYPGILSSDGKIVAGGITDHDGILDVTGEYSRWGAKPSRGNSLTAQGEVSRKAGQIYIRGEGPEHGISVTTFTRPTDEQMSILYILEAQHGKPIRWNTLGSDMEFMSTNQRLASGMKQGEGVVEFERATKNLPRPEFIRNSQLGPGASVSVTKILEEAADRLKTQLKGFPRGKALVAAKDTFRGGKVDSSYLAKVQPGTYTPGQIKEAKTVVKADLDTFKKKIDDSLTPGVSSDPAELAQSFITALESARGLRIMEGGSLRVRKPPKPKTADRGLPITAAKSAAAEDVAMRVPDISDRTIDLGAEVIKAYGGLEAMGKDLQDLIKAFPADDPTMLARFRDGVVSMFADKEALKLLQKSTPFERPKGLSLGAAVFREIMRNGLLSGLADFRNVLGNTFKTLFVIPSDALITATVEVAKSGGARLIGKDRPRQVFFSEIPESLASMYSGFWRGMREDFAVIMREGPAADELSRLDLQPEIITLLRKGEYGAKGKVVGNIANVLALFEVPQRFAIATDAVFKRGLQDYALHQRAIREAVKITKAEGLSAAEQRKLISDFLAAPRGKWVLEARDFARYETFNADPGAYGRWLINARTHAPFLGDLLLPFINTRLNIFKEGASRSPLAFIPPIKAGFIETSGKGSVFEKGISAEEHSRRIGRSILGSLGMVAIGYEVAQGNITGGGPSEDDPRYESWNKTHQPYSIKLGDNWVDYSQIPGGVAIPFMWAADAIEGAQFTKKKNVLSTFGAAMERWAGSVFNQHDYYDTLKDMLEAFDAVRRGQDLGDEAIKWVAKQAQQATPASGALRVYENFIDEMRRVPPPNAHGWKLFEQTYRSPFPFNEGVRAQGKKYRYGWRAVNPIGTKEIVRPPSGSTGR
ncbi:MAG TPA: hypothetical protein VFK94_06390 [Patescibacteria group bacterium]|nr:hypothetical protein [Patescibacteria group bacterium]